MATKEEIKLLQALNYAQSGWPVFPCKHYGKDVKKPITKNGFHDATTDEEQIMIWWIENPKALIGVKTGKEAGFWVVDVDVKNDKDGRQSLREAFGNELFDKKTMIQSTPSGGLHILFLWDDHHPVKCSTNLLPGIDIRGEGGYIVVDPSGYFIDNKWCQYKWKDYDFTISNAPEWAKQLTRMQGRSGDSGDFDVTKVMKGLSAGERDNELNRYAWHLSSRDVPYELALTFMLTAADKCKPAMDHATVEYQLQRAYERQSQDKTNKKDVATIKAKKQTLNDKEKDIAEKIKALECASD